MPEVLARFDEPLLNGGGTLYRAQACGDSMANGMWEGWVEFIPVGGGKRVRSPRETTQPNRADTAYWASGLTPIYLEGALERALRSPGEKRPPVRAAAPLNRPAGTPLPPPDIRRPIAHAILDPFAVYLRGESALRQKLEALSASHLRGIILEYELSEEPMAALDRLPYATLVETVVSGVRARMSPGGRV